MLSFNDAKITIDFPLGYDFNLPFDSMIDNIPYSGLRNISEF